MKLTGNAEKLLQSRYYQEGEDFDGLVDRLISIVDDEFKDETRQAIANLDFLPSSPVLMNVGTDTPYLAACHVLPIKDDLANIFETVKQCAIVFKYGGGIGIDFSPLRGKESKVLGTNGVASGPVSFMHVFDEASNQIKAGGRRRAASMGILNAGHPDIKDFIHCKSDGKKLQNFNISVSITNDFMEAAALPFTRESELFDEIATQAHKTGDPGIIFIDTINEGRENEGLKLFTATNACGEQPLLPYESCVLGSINLAHCVANGKVDKAKLINLIFVGVNYLKEVLNHTDFPLPEIEKATRKSNRIGLGIMGFADMLIQMKVPYDSDEAVTIAKEVARMLKLNADYPLPGRHEAKTTIAPTGSISMIADCSSGIEPIFAVNYTKKTADGKDVYTYQNKYYDPDIPSDVFKTAHEIPWERHIKIQAAFQKYIDSSISKTINMPNSAAVDDVKAAYRKAWELGCKGITIYRDGCRDVQALDVVKPEPSVNIRTGDRPDWLEGKTYKIKLNQGTLYVTVTEYDNSLYDVFVTVGKSGDSIRAFSETTGRLISLCLKSGVPVERIINQLSGIAGGDPTLTPNGLIKSIPDAIGNILAKHATIKSVGDCPECGGTLDHSEGCKHCIACGFSLCG